MINSNVSSSQTSSSNFLKIWFLGAILVSTIVAGALIASNQPILAIMFALFVAFMLAAILWPNSMTLLAVFLIYTNAPAIAVKFHGLPYIIGALFPLLMVIPLFNFVIIKKQPLIIPPIFYIVLFFYFVQILGTLVTKDISIGFSNLIKSIVEGILLYIVVINVVRTKEILHRAVWSLLIAGMIIGALGFYQVVTGTYDNNYAGFAQVSDTAFSTGQSTLIGDITQPRLAGSVGEQNRHAQIMLMLVPLGFYLIWGEKKIWLRILAAIATGFITLGVATAFSRGAALGFVLALLFMVAMRYIKVRQVLFVIIGIVILLAALPQYGTRLLRLEGLIGLIRGESSGTSNTTPDGALEGRTTSMLTAAQVFADYPIIGVGTGMFGYYYQDYAKFVGPRWEVGNRQAHDLYVGLLAENGLLGFLSFMAAIIGTMWMLAKTRMAISDKSTSYSSIVTGFIFALATYLGTGIGLHLGYYRFFWLIMALALATVLVAKENPENNMTIDSGKPIRNQLRLSKEVVRNYESSG